MAERAGADRVASAGGRELPPPTAHAPVLIARCDADRRYTFVNPAYAARLGLHPREVVGRPVRDVLGGPAYAAVERHIDAALAGERVEFEAELPDAGPGPRAVRCAYDPEFDPAGRVVGFVAAIVPAPESRRAADALRESEERFARFMGHLPGLAWIKDGHGRYVYANDAAVAAFGTPRSALYGRTDEAVFPPATAAHFRENDRKALAAGTGVRAVESLEHPDGAVRYSLVSKFPIPGPDGGPALVGGMAIDITEEMRTRAVLEESEERFRATFDQAAVGIAHVGTDGRWLRVNRKLCDIVGYAPDELMGLTFQDITHPDDVGADLAQLRRLVAGEITTYAMEKRYYHKDRRTVWVNLTVSLVRTPAGHPKYLISVVEDVTEKTAVEDALRESERKYRTLFQNMAEEVHFWRVERDDRGRVVTWRLVDANPPALKTWGKSLDDIRGRTADEVVGPGSTDHYRAVVEKVMAEGVPHAFEDYFPALDRHFRFTTVPVGDHFITTGADVTAVKKAHDTLRASEDRYRTVLESITDAFFAVGRDWRFTYVNRQAERLLGRTPGDLIGRGLWDEYPGLVGSEFGRAYRGVMEGRVAASVTAFYPDHDRWYEVHVYPAEGGISVYFRDVTARHRAEADVARLHAESDRMRRVYETALSNTPDYNFMFDLGGRFTYANETLLALWGRRADEALGRTPLELGYPPALADRLLRQVRQAADTRQPVRDETPFATAAGTREFEYALVPVVGAGGAVEAVVGSAHDITDRKRMEADLRQLAASLSDADRRKDEFLATLAHELRNPLAPLRTGLQVMRLAGADAGAVEAARSMMERQVGQMVRLVDDLMDVSRITRGKIDLRRERVPLAAVVGSAVETSRPLIEQMGHALTVTLPDPPVVVDADPTRLAQVFMNLLNNAAKYSDRGGHIRLTAGRQGGDVVVSVRDTGIGIPPDKLTTIFEMFSQVDRSLEKAQGGLGIGLTLVRRLVEMHDGRVDARSDGVGRGAEFVVRLPVPADAPGPRRDHDEPAAPTSSLRILVVDDNRDGADSLAMMLQIMGNDTATAYDGQEGVDVAGRVRPDVILLDIGLPKLNGYEACRRIRQQPWGTHPVLIAVTGWGQDEDRRHSRDAGFDHHLVKPVDPTALMRMLSGLDGTRD